MKKVLYLVPAAILLSGCSLMPAKSTPITGTEEQKAEKMAQIISSGGQADCKITNLSTGASTQMVVSGQKMKIMGTDLGEGKKGTMISDTQYTYFWTDGEKTGFKSKIAIVTPDPDSEKEMAKTSDLDTQTKAFEDDTKFKTDCSRRTISDSEFVPPTDVIFVDPSVMSR